MIVALIIASGKSTGWPNKNITPIFGLPLVSYPLLASSKSKYIDKTYVLTEGDATEIIDLAELYGAELLLKPKDSLSEDAFQYGYNEITKEIYNLEFFIPMFGNSPTINPKLIDKGIEWLRENKEYDSAVSVSKYNMWSPLRAMKIEDNMVQPFIDASYFKNANCDRDSQGDTYFIDNSVFVVKPHCMDYSNGRPPYRWIGKKVYPLIQEFGLDLDYEWQLPQAENWLRKYGDTNTKEN
jgi:CMP-N-acetylneuraminic acid synthetase